MPARTTPVPTRLSAAILTSAALAAGACTIPAAAGVSANPGHRILNPGNTGIPGQNNMMLVAFGPDGRLWTHGRDFFWGIGGVAALDFENGRWTTYSSAETPLDSWCYDVDFAADGAAWVASHGVIARIDADGETIAAHTPASTGGVLSEDAYEAISIAPNGHVWAASPGQVDLGGGLFEFDGTAWTKHEEPWMTTWTGFGYAPALSVIARGNGDVWASFLSSPGRVGRYRDGAWTVFGANPFIIDYAEDTDGALYGVGAFGCYRLDDQTDQWQPIGPVGGSSIALDPTSDDIYIESALDTVSRFDGSSWTTFATFPGWVDSLAVAPNGDVWIAAEAWASHVDLHHYDSSGQLLRIYNRSNTGMPSYFAPWMHRDRDGVMWFTDAEYGATRMQPDGDWRNFGIYNGQEEVHPFWTFPVGMPWWQTPGADFWTESGVPYHDSQGNVWLRGANIISRSHGADLSQWDTWEPGQAGLPWQIDSMGEDADGGIWVGDAFALYRLNGATWSDVPIGIPGQFAPVGLHQGRDGELYATRVATVYHVTGGGAAPVVSLPDGYGVITDLEADAAGNFWLGTPDHGALFWNGATFTEFNPTNAGLAELNVVDIAIRPGDGLVAVATTEQLFPPYDGGVTVFDGATWTSWNYGESFLPHYAVGEMEFDADGHLWVGVLNYGTVQILIGDDPGPGVTGDVTGDGTVDVNDLVAVILAWGSCPPPAPCPADIAPAPGGDGRVDVGDLVMVILNWSAP